MVVLALVLAFTPGGAASQPAATVRIVAIGDFGVGGATQKRFGAAVERFAARYGADLLVTLGDNDYTESPKDFLTNWNAAFGWTASAGVDVAGVLGNHDVRVQNGRYEFGALGMPGRYFRRTVGPVELFLLDSNRVDARQTAWLRRVLARSKARWRIAVAHHPTYTCGNYRSHPDVVTRWRPLFERHRVQLVLAGHDHNYQRFAPRRGVRYVVHGGGSTNLYPLQRCPADYPRRRRARVEQGFLYLVVRGNRLDGYAVTLSGRRTDHVVLAG